MKTRFLIPLGATLIAGCATNAPNKQQRDAPPNVIVTSEAPAPVQVQTGTRSFTQTPTSSIPTIITPEDALAVIEKFKQTYNNLGRPRMLIHVNRALVDEQSGIVLNSFSHTRNTDQTTVTSTIQAQPKQPGNSTVNVTTGGNVNVGGPGSQQYPPGPGTVTTTRETGSQKTDYANRPKPAPTLADRQTIRDVERLFGRPLRMGGVQLADQAVATQLLSNRSLGAVLNNTNSESARKDRQALRKITDVALEILVSSRQVTVPGISGNRVYTVPDIQATAIQLKDARIIGQAAAADIYGRDQDIGRYTQFDINQLTEAVAIALMEDITHGH
ncbi:MAG: hypothetical protein ACKVHO_06510 [Verrucomicrobiia bacterium]|jgi:hypothetical protein